MGTIIKQFRKKAIFCGLCRTRPPKADPPKYLFLAETYDLSNLPVQILQGKTCSGEPVQPTKQNLFG